MIRGNFLLFGYVKYTLKNEDVKLVLDLFLRKNFSVKFKKNTFAVRLGKVGLAEEIIGGKVELQRSAPLGLGGFLYRNKKRYGAISALILVFVLSVLSSLLVWDVRVVDARDDLGEAVISELREAGFSIGSPWNKKSLSRIQAKLLSSSDKVSWLNINRRGSVAYISVLENEAKEEPEEKIGYSNLIAKTDAIIEEITVIHGEAAVKVGDSVKKGDLLISGVLPTEAGGGFCYAEGIVKGRVSDTASVNVSREEVQKYVESSVLCDLQLNIFNFSAKIYKCYRNLPGECVIIEKKDELSLFGKSLPFGMTKVYATVYGEKTVPLSDEEITSRALVLMQETLAERLASATLIKIRTSAEFTDFGYTMTSELVYTENIGADLHFSAPTS